MIDVLKKITDGLEALHKELHPQYYDESVEEVQAVAKAVLPSKVEKPVESLPSNVSVLPANSPQAASVCAVVKPTLPQSKPVEAPVAANPKREAHLQTLKNLYDTGKDPACAKFNESIAFLEAKISNYEGGRLKEDPLGVIVKIIENGRVGKAFVAVAKTLGGNTNSVREEQKDDLKVSEDDLKLFVNDLIECPQTYSTILSQWGPVPGLLTNNPDPFEFYNHMSRPRKALESAKMASPQPEEIVVPTDVSSPVVAMDEPVIPKEEERTTVGNPDRPVSEWTREDYEACDKRIEARRKETELLLAESAAKRNEAPTMPPSIPEIASKVDSNLDVVVEQSAREAPVIAPVKGEILGVNEWKSYDEEVNTPPPVQKNNRIFSAMWWGFSGTCWLLSRPFVGLYNLGKWLLS